MSFSFALPASKTAGVYTGFVDVDMAGNFAACPSMETLPEELWTGQEPNNANGEEPCVMVNLETFAAADQGCNSNYPVLCQVNSISLSFFRKCLLGVCDLVVFSANRVSVRARRAGLRGDRCVLTTPMSTSSQYLASFFPRVVALFNALPEATKAKLVPALAQ